MRREFCQGTLVTASTVLRHLRNCRTHHHHHHMTSYILGAEYGTAFTSSSPSFCQPVLTETMCFLGSDVCLHSPGFKDCTDQMQT